MSIRFTEPVALWLLLGLIPIWLWSRRLRGLRPARRRLALALRVVGYALCVFALAGARSERRSDELTVFFVVDQSDSLGARAASPIVNYINDACRSMTAKDRAGVVVFGGDAAIECGPTRPLELDGFQSVVDRSQTSLAAGLRLAIAAFPQHTQKRIVLISDGLETKGRAEDEAEAARGNGIAIDVLPIGSAPSDDVLLEKLALPASIHLGEPFDVRIYARATKACRAKLRLLVNGQIVSGLSPDVELSRGKNVFAVPMTLESAGPKSFEAIIEWERDSRPENNRACAYAFIQGKPKVLLVDRDPAGARPLLDALRSEGADVALGGPNAIPSEAQEFQNYSALILSDISAMQLSASQMKMIQCAVRDFGMGLVMIGGPHSFGAGGYLNTPVEAALPVSMDVSNKRVLPRGALVVILHTCEFARGNAWARRIALAALNVLARRDLFGLLAYTGGPTWCVPLQEAKAKNRIRSIINTINPGDMPDFDATLRMAYSALAAADAGVKHIVIISDGDPSQPNPALADKIVAARITISTVVIAPHSGRDVNTMRDLASWGKGRFYNNPDPRRLPRIFIKEAVVVRKSLLFEKPFKPRVRQYSDILQGIGSDLPVLRGYVCTTAKPGAATPIVSQHDDPVLAHWRYGLGKAVAFTSDARNVWAARWLSWAKYDQFWAQVLQWVNRDVQDSALQVSTEASGGRGWVAVDAVDDQGRPLSALDMKAVIVTPKLERIETRLEQVAPGRYEARFDAAEVGTYLVNLTYRDRRGALRIQRAGLAVSYSPEFRGARSDEGLLRRLAGVTGGRVLRRTDPVFAHNLPSRVASAPWQGPLLATMACLFLIDVVVRRLFIDWRAVGAAVRKAAAWLRIVRPREPAAEQDEAMSRLMAAKAQATAPAAGPPAEPAAPEFLEQAMESEEEPEPQAPAQQEPPAEPEPSDDAASYTEQLLKAKRRARKSLE